MEPLDLRGIRGDQLTVLSSVQDHSLDLIVIDPPYQTGGDRDRYSDIDSKNRMDYFLRCVKVARKKLRSTGWLVWFINGDRHGEWRAGLDKILGKPKFSFSFPVRHGGPYHEYGKSEYIWVYAASSKSVRNLILGEKAKFTKSCHLGHPGCVRERTSTNHGRQFSRETHFIEIDKGVEWIHLGQKYFPLGPISEELGRWITPQKQGDYERDGFDSMKPLDLLGLLIQGFSPIGGNVFDGTAGSFTTLIACAQLGRNCTSVELVKNNVENAKVRVRNIQNSEDLTKQILSPYTQPADGHGPAAGELNTEYFNLNRKERTMYTGAIPRVTWEDEPKSYTQEQIDSGEWKPEKIAQYDYIQMHLLPNETVLRLNHEYEADIVTNLRHIEIVIDADVQKKDPSRSRASAKHDNNKPYIIANYGKPFDELTMEGYSDIPNLKLEHYEWK